VKCELQYLKMWDKSIEDYLYVCTCGLRLEYEDMIQHTYDKLKDKENDEH
jgi:hypothetical protein